MNFAFCGINYEPIYSGVSAGVFDTDDYVDVLELGPEGCRIERHGVFVLEHNCHDVVADMTLAHQLMRINKSSCIHVPKCTHLLLILRLERQHGADVEHDLIAVNLCEQRMRPSQLICIQIGVTVR